jgi:hypothetical protein
LANAGKVKSAATTTDIKAARNGTTFDKLFRSIWSLLFLDAAPFGFQLELRWLLAGQRVHVVPWSMILRMVAVP